MRSYLLILAIIGLNFTCLQAQNSSLYPEGYFWQDTTMVGEELQFSLRYVYPRSQRIIFPDSSYNYFPFEFSKKEYFPTRKLDSAMLIDSVVYTLATFEIDSILYLRVPVFLLDGGDSIPYYSSTDSVLFKSVVGQIPEPPELKSNTKFAPIETQFNYIYFSIAAAIIIVVIVVLAIIFGKDVYKKLVIYRLKKGFEKFDSQYSTLLEKVSTDNSKETTERILNLWKRYMEKLDSQPVTKFTTKEISIVYQNDQLKDSLRNIDKKLYGNIQTNNLNLLLGNLKDFSLEQLHKKIEEVKHG